MNGEQEKQAEEAIIFRADPALEHSLYVQVRCDLLCSPHFTPSAKVLYMLLCYHARPDVSSWSGNPLLAGEYGIEEPELQDALQLLADARLITPIHAGESRQRVYVVHLLPTKLPTIDSIHIPQELTQIKNEQVETDTQLLIKSVGISEAAARRSAQLAAERGNLEGYVAEVIEYALSTPGIKNPAGCVVELIRRNESRKPSTHLLQQITNQSLDPKKYTTGKYAFLFRRHPEAEGAWDHIGGAGDDQEAAQRDQIEPEGQGEKI